MAKSQPKLLGFNGGVISPLALARQDIPRVSVSAEEQTNLMPRHMGSGMLRAGLGFITPILPKYTNTTLTVDVGGAKTLATATGLANNATVYTATLTYGAFSVDISVVGSASQTYATLLSGIYTDMLADPLGGEAITVSLVDGNIVFEVQAHGDATAFALVDSGANSLFATLTNFASIGTAVLGEDDVESNSKLIDFIYSKDDTAKISLVDSRMRVLVSDAYIEPPESFASVAVNGHFLYTLNSWTDADDSGCTSAFAAGDDGAGYMSLVGTGFNYARRNQQITVAGADEDKEHQCRIVIERGVVDLRIGVSAGDGSYVSITLTKGTHYFSFFPTGSFYVEFSSATKYASLVQSIYFHTGGLLIETDYEEDVFPFIRHAQSGNVVYLAAQRIRPQKIIRSAFTQFFNVPTRAYCIVNVGGNKTGASATGLLNTSQNYGFGASGSFGGGGFSRDGQSMQTFAEVITALNTGYIGGLGFPITASLDGGNIKVTFNTAGPESFSVWDLVVPGTLAGFSALSGFTAFETPVDGTSSTAAESNSWSLADYLPEDGPFLPYNATGITLVSSALSGDVTITASKSFFQGHVGALFQIDSAGQKVTSTLSGQDQWSNSIRVAGITRSFFAIRSSIGTNTVTLQRSIDGESSWTDIATYTTNATSPFNDGLDNQIVYYRIGIKTGGYTSGSPVVTLTYSEGSISGICRITAVASGTSASAIVLRDFGSTIATVDWREGAWSDYRGYPSATAIAEGRLWWFGKQNTWGSRSDFYETFNPDLEGADRPISRTIGFGSADNINWAVGGERLLIATDMRILEAKSSNDGYPMTQDDFSLRVVTSQGAAKVNPVKVDKDVVYVQNAGTRLIHLSWNGAQYVWSDLTALSPEIGEPSITHLAIQHQPDVRLHCVRSDGKTVVLLFDPVEDLQAFIPVETDGDIEDVVIFPGSVEDQVYYVPKRDFSGPSYATDAGVVRYIEKFALESECQGGSLSKQLDSFIVYSGVSTTTITGLEHFEGEDVYVFSTGVLQGPFTVASAQITITTAVTIAVIGQGYTARFKSIKLGQLMDKKSIPQVGLIMRNVHPLSIRVGQDFDHLKPAIQKSDWRKTAGEPDSSLVIEDYHKEMSPIDGTWTTDSRLCFEIEAPYSCTLLAAVMNLEGNEK